MLAMIGNCIGKGGGSGMATISHSWRGQGAEVVGGGMRGMKVSKDRVDGEDEDR